jgi:anti-sigma factor RsiW
MSATSCHLVREAAPDFALGALTGRERAAVVAHLDDCPACRTLVGEYASVADGLLELIPDAEPADDIAPPVLAAMRPPRRHGWRRRVVALAAAAIVAIGAGTALTAALVSSDDGGTGSSASPALQTAPMVGSAGATVGRVVTTNDRPPTLAVSVDYWLPDGSYALAARSATGDSAPVGSLEVVEGRGAWTGSSSPIDHPAAITLVDPSGSVVCEGRLA